MEKNIVKNTLLNKNRLLMTSSCIVFFLKLNYCKCSDKLNTRIPLIIELKYILFGVYFRVIYIQSYIRHTTSCLHNVVNVVQTTLANVLADILILNIK